MTGFCPVTRLSRSVACATGFCAAGFLPQLTCDDMDISFLGSVEQRGDFLDNGADLAGRLAVGLSFEGGHADTGGLGVFDPGINALSILTRILPKPVFVTAAELAFPANCQAPIAANLTLTDISGLPVTAEFDFRQTGPQSWDIVVETDQGRLTLSRGGARMAVDGKVFAEAPDEEYRGLYRRFVALAATGESDVDLTPLRGRRATPADLERFDYVIAMDRSNLGHLREMAGPAASAKVRLFMEFTQRYDEDEVPDPYYGGGSGFERVLDMVEAASEGLLADIEQDLGEKR